MKFALETHPFCTNFILNFYISCSLLEKHTISAKKNVFLAVFCDFRWIFCNTLGHQ
jgi:hypothetical protein